MHCVCTIRATSIKRATRRVVPANILLAKNKSPKPSGIAGHFHARHSQIVQSTTRENTRVSHRRRLADAFHDILSCVGIGTSCSASGQRGARGGFDYPPRIIHCCNIRWSSLQPEIVVSYPRQYHRTNIQTCHC